MSYRTDEELRAYGRRRVTLAIVLCTLAALAVLVPAGWYISKKIAANEVLREARNTRLAMRYLSLIYEGEGKSMADPSAADGFSSGTAEQIGTLADVSGQLYLYAWDDTAGVPLSYTYTSRGFVASYTYDPATRQSVWHVSYALNMLNFSH